MVKEGWALSKVLILELSAAGDRKCSAAHWAFPVTRTLLACVDCEGSLYRPLSLKECYPIKFCIQFMTCCKTRHKTAEYIYVLVIPVYYVAH